MCNFAKTSPERVEPSAAVEPHPSAADFVHNLTCNECLKVYNAGNKTILECGKVCTLCFSFLYLIAVTLYEYIHACTDSIQL